MERFHILAVFCAVLAVLARSGAAQTAHVVGDGLGWSVPSDPAAYSNWAAGRTFRVGDVLVFNFVTNRDDVVRVTKASFDVCSDDGDIGEDLDFGPANYTLNAPGDYYFISSEDNHCLAGLKLAITVVPATAGGATPPTAAPPPPPLTRPVVPPPRASPAFPTPATATVHIVGDRTGWTVPPNATFYQEWAAGRIFRAGDILEFNFVTNRDDVVRVPKASFDLCSDDNDIGEDIDFGPANYTLTNPGDYYFISSEDNHCRAGQKLAITVVPATAGSVIPPVGAPRRPPQAFPQAITPTVHIVGDLAGWAIPSNTTFYQEWAAGKTFRVGDILVFNFTTNRDDLVRVTKPAFDACSDDNDIQDIDIGPTNFTLTTPGDYYFISSYDGHCRAGQKLALTAVSATSGATLPPMNNAPGPNSGNLPFPSSAPPLSSAASFSFLLLSAAVALCH